MAASERSFCVPSAPLACAAASLRSSEVSALSSRDESPAPNSPIGCSEPTSVSDDNQFSSSV